MINIEYTMSPEEMAKATLDFLANRPFISLMFLIMKIACFGFCIGFAITWHAKATKPQDFLMLVMAIVWLFSFKKINLWMIKKRLDSKRFNAATNTIRMDHRSIFCKLQSSNPLHIEWKKLKYVLQNKDGYIIPLTGVSNVGKFMWLPHRCFTNQATEQEFIDLVNKFKLKIKKLSKS